MNIWTIAGGASLILLICFFFLFSLYSLLEKEKRALWRSSIVLFLLLAAGFVFFFVKSPIKNWLFGSTFAILMLSASFVLFSPLKRRLTEIVGGQIKVDERDIIFSRFDYREGTETYEEYYTRRPEYKKIDDEIRKIPDILSPLHMKKNTFLSSLASAEFDFLEHQLTQVSGNMPIWLSRTVYLSR